MISIRGHGRSRGFFLDDEVGSQVARAFLADLAVSADSVPEELQKSGGLVLELTHIFRAQPIKVVIPKFLKSYGLK